jgi:hypothetical protein
MSKFGNLPEVVKYIEFGKEHFAFPIASRDLEHHLGSNNEPLLTLVIAKPPLDPTDPLRKRLLDHLPPGFPVSEAVHVVYDVAHGSHEFGHDSMQALAQQGITVAQVYPGGKIPGGRWRELTAEDAESLVRSDIVPIDQAKPSGGPSTLETIQ